MLTCPGSLVLHRGDTVAACTLDELDGDGQCVGIELPHEGKPLRCWYVFDGCALCGNRDNGV